MRPVENLPTLPANSAGLDWKAELLHSLSSVEDLVRAGLLTSVEASRLERPSAQYKIRITPYYASLIENRPDCPIRQQALPSLSEEDPLLPSWAMEQSQILYQRPHPWHGDAIGDLRNLAAPRLTHRYSNRAILHLSSMCAVYCRFCFRKSHLNDEDRTLYDGSLDASLDYLRSTPTIRELILTGGDPLSLPDAALRKLFMKIAEIPHIRILRIHSRMCVTLPSRCTQGLAELMSEDWPFGITLVSHFNHPKEITPLAIEGLRRMKKAGVTLLNQAVLLEGVNTSQECLVELFQKLYELGVLPFYLHYPDWTPGTFHFRPSIEKAIRLVQGLRGRLSGPALPDLILDIPQGYGKVSLLGTHVRKIRDFTPTSENSDSRIGGALYQLVASSTRAEKTSSLLYLDLFQVAGNPSILL